MSILVLTSLVLLFIYYISSCSNEFAMLPNTLTDEASGIDNFINSSGDIQSCAQVNAIERLLENGDVPLLSNSQTKIYNITTYEVSDAKYNVNYFEPLLRTCGCYKWDECAGYEDKGKCPTIACGVDPESPASRSWATRSPVT
jgi:hypothetical protein